MDRKPEIRIMRPGVFTSVEGQTVEFGSADLAAAAAAYDPDSDPAPLVIGHPALDAPAYGWVSKLRIEGDHLVAEPDPDRLEPAFAEAVRAGRYRKVSASFYPPRHPANPKPGSFYLKHVGFLGAAAPAVKGLGTVHFNEHADDAPLATIETEETPVTEQTADFAEREAELARREAELQERETAIAEKEAQAEAAARQARHDANVAFAESLIAEAKLAPAAKAKVVGLLDVLDTLAVAQFGEGDGAEELSPADAFKKLFEGAKPVVSLGEHVQPGSDGDLKVTVSFAAPAGYTVDRDQAELHRRAKALQAENPELSFMDAVKRVQAAG